MRAIFSLLFLTPFWVQFLIAGGLGYVGYSASGSEAARAVAVREMAAQPAPETIPIGAFHTDKPTSVPVEVSVTAQLAVEHSVTLVTRKNGRETDRDLLIVLVDADAPAGTTEAKGAIVFDSDDEDAYFAYLDQAAIGRGPVGPVVRIDGIRERSGKASHAQDAMDENGVTRSADFFYIKPFIGGREASLAAMSKSEDSFPMIFYGAAAIMALLGVFKFLRGRRAKVT